MLYQKENISESERSSFYSNLKIGDLVLNNKHKKISVITEIFKSQPPQIDDKHYIDVDPIYLTKPILTSLGFLYLYEERTKFQTVLYYKYLEKTVYNGIMGISISNDSHIVFGMYITIEDKVAFIPMISILYLNDLQHILHDSYGFNMEFNSLDQLSEYLYNQMESDKQKLLNSFNVTENS